MKITRSQLKQLITEEIGSLNEQQAGLNGYISLAVAYTRGADPDPGPQLEALIRGLENTLAALKSPDALKSVESQDMIQELIAILEKAHLG